ncbi:flagellar biogenesis protein FliO [Paenibacillus sp. PvP094]
MFSSIGFPGIIILLLVILLFIWFVRKLMKSLRQ